MKKKFLNVMFDDISLESVLSKIEYDEYKYIITPNVDHVVRMDTDKNFYHFYKNAYLSLCDSRVIQLLSIFLSEKINNVLPGSDLTQYLFENIIEPNDSVFILGSDIASIELLKLKYGLSNVKHFDPSMGFIKNRNEIDYILDLIKESNVKYIFLAVGSPQQEQVAYELKKYLSSGTAFCIGASINFLTGKAKRAPVWMQKNRLEWFYRFLMEPRRLFKRYFIDGLKLVVLIFRHR